MLRLLSALVLICSPLVALAAPRHLDSPGKVLSVEIDTDPDGRPSYRVMRNGKPVIAPSRLGFILVDAPKFERNLVLGTPVIRSFDQTWEQPWGERRSIRNHYNELRVTLTERIAPGAASRWCSACTTTASGSATHFPTSRSSRTSRSARR
jgi:alpha-glucosidase